MSRCICGEAIFYDARPGPRPSYCSTRCRNSEKYRRSLIKKARGSRADQRARKEAGLPEPDPFVCVCGVCGEQFSSFPRRDICRSGDCHDAVSRRRAEAAAAAAAARLRPCAGCDEMFTPYELNGNRKLYWHPACWAADVAAKADLAANAEPARCEHCTKPLASSSTGRPRKWCGDACRVAHRRATARPTPAPIAPSLAVRDAMAALDELDELAALLSAPALETL